MIKKNNNISKLSHIQFYIVIFLIAIVPFLIRFQFDVLDAQTLSVWNGAVKIVDFFSLFKSRIIMLIGLLTLILLIIKIRVSNFIWNFPVFLLLTYMVLVIISSILSKYQTVAWFGFVERYEGAFVIISYVLAAVASIQIFSEFPQLVPKLLNAFLWSGVLMAAIGLSQFFNADFMATEFFKHLVLPSSYSHIKLKFAFSGQNIIYATLYNPNYVGSYASLYFYISIWSLFEDEAKNLRQWICSVIFLIAAIVLLFGSMSKSGIVGTFITFIPFMFFIIIIWKKKILRLAISISLMFIVVLVMNMTSNNKITDELFSFIPLQNLRKHNENNLENRNIIFNESSNIKETPTKVVAISLEKNLFKFTTDFGTLILMIEENQLKLFDTSLFRLDDINSVEKSEKVNGEEMIVYDITINDKRYKMYSIMFLPTKQIVLFDTGLFGMLPLKYNNGNFYIIYRGKDMVHDIVTPKIAIFKAKEHFVSNRGYIWGRIIPLLKHNIFLGDGPDTIPFIFPQTDIVGKMNTFNNPLQIIDKPHCWYLQVVQGSGLISLAVLIILFLLLFVKVLFVGYIRKNTACIFIAMSLMSYLIVAIANDSVVSVAPIFWTLLGTAFANLNFSSRFHKP